MARKHASVTQIKAVYKGYIARLACAEAMRRKALGIHAEMVYKRGHVVSGRYLVVTGE